MECYLEEILSDEGAEGAFADVHFRSTLLGAPDEKTPPSAQHKKHAPPARGGSSITAVGSTRLYTFGGAARTGQCFGVVNVYDLKRQRWALVPTKGPAPSPRSGHTATALPDGRRLVVFGGINMRNQQVFNDVYILDTKTLTWTKPDVRGGTTPAPRNSHTANLYTPSGGGASGARRVCMLVFGGSSPDVGPLNDVFSLDLTDPSSPEWTALQTTAAASTSSGKASGSSTSASSSPSREAPAATSPRRSSGRAVGDASLAQPREMHAAAVINGTLHVFGGARA